MDDDPVAVDDAPGIYAPEDAPAAPAAPGPARVSRRRIWLRRVGVVALALLLVGLSGLQIQVSRVRAQVDRSEIAQQNAEGDEDTARIRLESVGDRVRLARAHEDEAQDRLDASRAAMTAQGFEEDALHSLQVKTAEQVKDLRAGVKKVAKDIAAQNRLQPAAAACLFDMLRALGRVDAGATGGRASEACKTTMSSPGPA